MAEKGNREGRGVLFKNDRKQTEKHADYTGSINIGGQEYWLSAWVEQSGAGVKYFSISAKPKEVQSGTATASKPLETPATTTRVDDEDLPF